MTTPATTDKNNDNNTSSNTNNNSSNKKSNESRQQQRDMARTTTMAAGKASRKMREENIWHTLRRAKSVSRANLFWRKFHFTNRIDSYAFHFIFSLLTFCLSRSPDFPHFPPFPPSTPRCSTLKRYSVCIGLGQRIGMWMFGVVLQWLSSRQQMKDTRTFPGPYLSGFRWVTRGHSFEC